MDPLFTTGFVDDPYPTYAHLREAGPAHRITLPGGVEAWLVTRDKEVRQVFLSEDFSKEMETHWYAYREGRLPMVGDVVIAMADNMLVADPPKHTRLRSSVTREFTRKRVHALAPRVRETVARLLEQIIAKREGADVGHVDLVEEFAALVPMRVICPLLGISDEDGEFLRPLVSTVMSNDDNGQRNALAASQGVNDYLAAFVKDKRGTSGDDLSATLVEHSDLSDQEVVEMLALLMAAGHETTVNLLGSSVLALLRHPEQLTRVTHDPERWPAVVEEVLRWDSPVQNVLWRFTRNSVTLGDVTIPPGEAVALSVAAAHRDPQRYEDPDTFDIGRNRSDHVAFGHGIHRCIGAELARMEARTALPLLFERLPGLRLAGAPSYRPSTISRALSHLPVTYGPEVHVA
ncbi:cytochrome P450 family protein [Nocardiopsis salina]|uniref:cytochrome P450 family protein n=1 Tax=Nocardiopsis salina TaxID=245836 RepID=UPI0003490283|nr:cytochrome P450 [Nocardiopsis salina]